VLCQKKVDPTKKKMTSLVPFLKSVQLQQLAPNHPNSLKKQT
jgi:hypothetical protein